MKRLITILTLALVVGCHKESRIEDLEVGTALPISISVSSNEESDTRGSLVTTEADMSTVGLYCAHTVYASWDTSTTYKKISNGEYTYQDSEWSTITDTAWGHSAMTEKYSFNGYSPYNTTTNGISPSIVAGELQVVYTVPESSDKHVDLLIATPRKDIHPQTGGKVHMQFNHALSCIDFQASGSECVTVTKIEITGLKRKGTFTYKDESGINCDLTDNTGSVYTASFKSDITLNTDNYQPILADDGYLMLLPQDITAGSDVKIVVSYTISDGGAVQTKEFDAPTNTWEPAQRYTYLFKLSDQILMNPNVIVTAWDEEATPESYSDDVMPLPAINCINLDNYTTTEALTETVEERLNNGITEFVVYGTLQDGVSIGGSTSNKELGLNAKATDNETRATKLDLSRVNGCTSIGKRAFTENEKLEKVILPETITHLGEDSFSKCSSLISVEGLSNVESIDSYAFWWCVKLESLIFTDKLKSIDGSAFRNCESVTDVGDLSNITKIESNTFYYCKKLTRITLTDKITTIPDSAFCNCESLTDVDFISNVTSIGHSAFRGCKKLEKIPITNKIKKLETFTFYDCNSLTDVGDLSNVTDIGTNVFVRCEKLTTITLTDKITTIPNGTFDCCESLTNLDFLNNVTSIGNDAFSGCASMTSINLPLATAIGNYAFEDCTNMTSINLPLATAIGNSAFENCTSMTSINLPLANTIGYSAFMGLSDDTKIYLTAAADKINVGYYISSYKQYSDDWSNLNLYIRKGKVLDDDIIVTPHYYDSTTDPQHTVMTYKPAASDLVYNDGYYTWKSVNWVDVDNGGAESVYVHSASE